MVTPYRKEKRTAFILLIVLIAVGGIVLFGKDKKQSPIFERFQHEKSPAVKGPSTPPPIR